MSTERCAWLVVSVAGITCGVIAGIQHCVTIPSVAAIFLVIAVAGGLVSRLRSRGVDHAA
jgi:small basic protein